MRRLIFALAAAAALAGAPASMAAPTCQDRNGGTIRCGTEGAMPVGWTLPPEERPDPDTLPADPSLNTLLELFCAMGVFFGLMALLPDFDGWGAGDWERSKSKDSRRR
jgi:hypothetical protein